ncbi:nitrilase [Cladophialophora carrionii]|uniref:Nitrilase n=1 Tax=Cladophialophora carrionii TaxID=86049 RepID=A0A1C1CNK6_9EURO|nr:nitrilase [Cladophialophora carrionii]
MPQLLRIGISQSHTLSSLQETLFALKEATQRAAQQGISILLFPEAYLGGYPRTCNFGAAVGGRTDWGRDQFLAYTKGAVDLGDTPQGAEQDWIDRQLPVNKETGRRGDGTREFLEDVARETGVFIVTGLIEKAGGSLYCTAVYVDPKRGIIGKRRKVMPTASERLVWAQGSPSTLKAVATTIKGVRVVMGCAICWENFMPLLRYSLYSQGVNLWLAPTADGRDTWEPLMRTIAAEGRCFVLSTNQCIKRKDLPTWITGDPKEWLASQSQSQSLSAARTSGPTTKPEGSPLTNGTSLDQHASGFGRRLSITRTEENHSIAWRGKDTASPAAIEEGEEHKDAEDSKSARSASAHPPPIQQSDGEEFLSRGGACIVDPMGKTLVGPAWEQQDALLWRDVDFEDCERGHLDFDVTGHYSRPDAFHLTVEGLDLVPPP